MTWIVPAFVTGVKEFSQLARIQSSVSDTLTTVSHGSSEIVANVIFRRTQSSVICCDVLSQLRYIIPGTVVFTVAGPAVVKISPVSALMIFNFSASYSTAVCSIYRPSGRFERLRLTTAFSP